MQDLNHGREHERIDFNRMVLLTGEQEYGGYIHDVSANGISVGFVSPEDQNNHTFKMGDSITVAIENIGAVTGNVKRILGNGLAVALDVSGKDEEKFIAQIKDAKNRSAANA
ncbi:MAG: PilZ domain-containing protein [Rhodospirillales bacterium]